MIVILIHGLQVTVSDSVHSTRLHLILIHCWTPELISGMHLHLLCSLQLSQDDNLHHRWGHLSCYSYCNHCLCLCPLSEKILKVRTFKITSLEMQNICILIHDLNSEGNYFCMAIHSPVLNEGHSTARSHSVVYVSNCEEPNSPVLVGSFSRNSPPPRKFKF